MKTQSGITLVEVMVTMALAIIILAVGIPAFINMLSTNQAAGYANELVSAMRLARSEAVKRSQSVTICASNIDQTGCSGSDWNNGWIVFSDDNADLAYDAGEEIYRVWSIPTDERPNLVFEGGSPTAVRFNSTGANSLDAQISFAFKKIDCTAPMAQARQITISRLGRATVNVVACF
jgi:type IV fimbrial biogenesis protein FimT